MFFSAWRATKIDHNGIKNDFLAFIGCIILYAFTKERRKNAKKRNQSTAKGEIWRHYCVYFGEGKTKRAIFSTPCVFSSRVVGFRRKDFLERVFFSGKCCDFIFFLWLQLRRNHLSPLFFSKEKKYQRFRNV